MQIVRAMRGVAERAAVPAAQTHPPSVTIHSRISRCKLAGGGQRSRVELRARDRQALLAQSNESGLTASSHAAYLNRSVSTRATMSAEECSLWNSNPALR